MCCGDSVIAVTCVTLNTAAAGTSIVSSPFLSTAIGAPLQLTLQRAAFIVTRDAIDFEVVAAAIGRMLPFDLLLLAGELRAHHLLDAIAVLDVGGRENAAERHLAVAAGVGRETGELHIEVRLDDIELQTRTYRACPAGAIIFFMCTRTRYVAPGLSGCAGVTTISRSETNVDENLIAGSISIRSIGRGADRVFADHAVHEQHANFAVA